MKLLVGTSNPSKVDFFRQFIDVPGVELVTLGALGISGEPQETGKSPSENAMIKARYYGQYADCVICADSGLYFDELALEDPRQPGLHIRTPQGERLDDEEMIRYYSALVHSLGGRVRAYYLDGFAVKMFDQYDSFSATREESRERAFTLIDSPYPQRRAGWPLDSLSIDHEGIPFLDPNRAEQNTQQNWGYRGRLKVFLREKLSGK